LASFKGSNVRASWNSLRTGEALRVRDSGTEWIKIAVQEPALSLEEHRYGHGLVRLYSGDRLVEHSPRAVISFLPNPGRAVAEMARVVRPGGWVAAYMWDSLGGGTPVHPIYLAMESIGMTSVRSPNPAASGRDAMQGLWKSAGLESVETRVIPISTVYSDFDDFRDSNTVPIGRRAK
jgi:hypothetical protein